MTSLVERWTALGFTEYEAKAYVALLQLGTATGYQIAKESGVPRSMVYESLSKLIARGAVLTQSTAETVRYAPVPPDQLLGRMRRELDDQAEALSRELKSIVIGGTSAGGTWSLSGRQNVLAHARQMIERAEQEIALSIGDDDELDELLPSLQHAQGRKLSLLVISTVPYDAGRVPVVVHPLGQQLRQAVGHGLTLVVDGRQALIGEVDRSETAVWTTNRYTVAWALWCIKHELAERPAYRKQRRQSKK
jgi:HTH-type transcriptional regulator, sugar sensing transcriptional regulator